MHEEFTIPPQSHADAIQTLRRKVAQLTVAFAVFAILSACCFVVLVISSWQEHRTLSKTDDDIMFSQFSNYDYDSDDYVAPVTNTIQFFHNGYSMQFDKVEFTPNGLFVSGEIGNPNQFRITNLTLTFAARPFPTKIREKWAQAGRTTNGWSPDWDLGRERITIENLEAGQVAQFNLTIPNVKKNPDPLRIAVLFSGEHYVYTRKPS